MQQCETPDQAAAYWKAHIANRPYFNSEYECLAVFILNTRRRIKGRYLVSIGTMDTILCHPRQVFRLAIMAGAAAIISAHNLCVAAHKLCAPWIYVHQEGRSFGGGRVCSASASKSRLAFEHHFPCSYGEIQLQPDLTFWAARNARLIETES
jgi:hypothetical protein